MLIETMARERQFLYQERKGEMPDETVVPAETAAVETPAAETVADDFDKERAMQTIEKLRTFEKEASKLKKQVEAYEKAERERAQAELSETEKLKAQLDEALKAKKHYELTALKAQAASEAGLPAELAGRLTGETLEELKADAGALVKLLPAAPKAPPKITPTTPGEGKPVTETKQQRLNRIMGLPT